MFGMLLIDILDNRLGFLLKILAMVLIPQFTHTIAKVDLDAPLINQNIVHPRIGKDTLILCLKLYEGILKRITSFPVTNNLAGNNFAKA